MDQLYIGRRVNKYDGQSIYVEGKKSYEIGNYLGHGSAGRYFLNYIIYSVYEATDFIHKKVFYCLIYSL